MHTNKANIREININDLTEDAAVIARPTSDEKHVQELVEAIQRGSTLPPVTVFYDSVTYFLVDGSHRRKAFLKCGKDKMMAEVREGTKRDAMLFSCKVNSEHGLPRKNEDKRNAVYKLLNDSEWQEWSDNVIAEKCAVTQPFVSGLRKNVDAKNGFKSPGKRITKNGKTMSVEGIGGQGSGKRKGSKAELDSAKPEEVNTEGAAADIPTPQGLSENEIVQAKDSIISLTSGLKSLDGMIPLMQWDEAKISIFTKTKSNLETAWTKLAVLMAKLEEHLNKSN